MSPPHSLHFHVTEGPDGLVVGDRRRVAPAIAGALFLAAGLGIWGFIALLIGSHLRAGSLGEPGGYLPMVGLLLAGGAPFVWVGVRLALHSHAVRLPRGAGIVEDIDSYVLYRRVRARRLAGFTAVRMRRLTRARSGSNDTSSTGTSQSSVVLELTPSDASSPPVRLAFDYADDAIRALGGLVARHTGLPLHDALHETHYE